MNDINLCSNLIRACSNLIRVFNKGFETITAEALMLLITVYPVYALNADVQQSSLYACYICHRSIIHAIACKCLVTVIVIITTAHRDTSDILYTIHQRCP